MEQLTIALVDDHRLFRSGIASLIETFPAYRVIFEAGSGEEFIDRVGPGLRPDIVLLDLNMPGMNGIETSEWIRSNYPDMKVIAVSMIEEAGQVLAMIRTGIKAYLLKDSAPDEFRQALDAVAANEVYFPAAVSKHMANSFAAIPDDVQLNPRELEFLKLIASDMTYREIADIMCLSSRTIDGYRDKLFEKLNVKSRSGLVIYAIKKKIVKL